MAQVVERGEPAFRRIEEILPPDFPGSLHESVLAAAKPRLAQLAAAIG